MMLGGSSAIEVARLAPYPLLLLNSGYGLRRAFDAACRLAGLTPKIRLETRSPHTLLALAEAQHGVAIIASTFQAKRYNLKIMPIAFRGETLREPLAVLWDKRRPLPKYATAFCQMWAEHVRAVFPITRPTVPIPGAARKKSKSRSIANRV
jgi:DNA-binding transcriptional LysR family regulator